jgi:CheY-like chemotaxis protein
MRETPEVRDLPVVFITAKASQRELDELRKLGALGTISKPFSPKDLPDQLRRSGTPALRRGYIFTVFSAP